MALRDLPYIPLYIQDFLTDEKLIECSASATGVYIRLLCIMHKSERYGTILLQQKDKQNTKQLLNFASKIAKQMPFTQEVILSGISELLEEKVIVLNGDFLEQPRMIRDEHLSNIRAASGKKGGTKNKNFALPFAPTFATAKQQANSEDEIEGENDIEIKLRKERYENFRTNYLQSEISLTELCKATEKDIKNMPEIISDYNSHLISGGENHKTEKDYRKHLRNWLLSKNGMKQSNGSPNRTPKLILPPRR